MLTSLLTEEWFVQSFSNLNYLNYLAQNQYLEDERFMSYLRYLYNYWSQPENVRYIIWPNCLHVLKLLLNSSTFKYEILKREVADIIMNGMIENWHKSKSVEMVGKTKGASNSNGSTSIENYTENNNETETVNGPATNPNTTTDIDMASKEDSASQSAINNS
ncbi:hypothetical protein DASC09_058570 [Saccharomycopsis crataegensis]|uniref:Mediator of RNA polymerase II transcription subunit 31 n=1 Tax=Saccharomycopsis crataegensis TaxID=43959 RepID=A0AAV5QWM7_9ASCO|nr:hypothetical protein DASC09_058570 [Saccharomycopsis crataegensis]